ncbi:MAG: vWA domain-containing protein, partial [Ardenticatenales bacterium]
GVTAGAEFASEVAVRVTSGEPLDGVVACDKWDNDTHVLRDGGVAGARVWWQMADGDAEAMAADAVVIEYATGRWGRGRAAGDGVGRGWYVQSTASCADPSAVDPPGWVLAGDVDFLNAGRRAVDATDINMVRARFLEPLPPGIEVWLEVLLVAGPNRAGTWLMNYGAAAWGDGSQQWRTEACDGAAGNGSLRHCPEPTAGTRGRPGPLGDMLVHVGVPLWITKHNDPIVPGGSPIVDAGQTTAFTLEVAALPRPDDPPPPAYPPSAYAAGVVVTDTLPRDMAYVPGSATIASEDIDGDGVLGPGEDRNGNGRIDADVPFEPIVGPGLYSGETALSWPLGDLPYRRRAPTIRFEGRVSRLVRAGTSLTNWAAVAEADGPPTVCRTVSEFDRPVPFQLNDRSSSIEGTVNGRCAWAHVIVANSAAAQVEKVAQRATVLAGEPMVFRLSFANLSTRPVEWFDAVDILPRLGEPRDPESRITGGFTDVQVGGLPGWPPIEVWASAADPDALDIADGGPRDGLVDPVAAWGDGTGNGGVGIGGAAWPCLLADVGARRCNAISSLSAVTALRIWGKDPDPRRSGGLGESLLTLDSLPRYVDVLLAAPGSAPGDIAHNAWGGRFEGLPLPVFDDAVIRVHAPATATPSATTTPIGTATDTPSPPSATASTTVTPASTAPASSTSTQTSSATETPSTVATATATVLSPHRIYLPMSLRLPCSRWPVDAVLVIDLSTSMRRPAGDGGTKLDAVLRAARAFLDRFAPDVAGGHVAVVAFNVRAWTVQPLTGDRGRLDSALASLPTSVEEGTRLDLGLLEGTAALGDGGQRRVRAMVFLTDGLPNWVPTPEGGGRQEDTVLAAAAAAHARGVTIHTVGYGRPDAADPADRIAPELLRAIAGSAAGYHETDDAGELASVFEGIAAGLGCAETAGWPAPGERLRASKAPRE